MDAKFGNFSEMANPLSVKSRVSGDLTTLYARFFRLDTCSHVWA